MKYQFACIFNEVMINVEASWPAVVAISQLLFERAALQHKPKRDKQHTYVEFVF